MRKQIQDEFTHLPLSRQRKYQLRRQRDGRCTECGAPAPEGSRCLKHLILAREHQRNKLGLLHRYETTLSYRLASKPSANVVGLPNPAASPGDPQEKVA